MDTPRAATRQTTQKRLILACLRNHQGAHMTADELIFTLRAQKTPVGKTTVYRVLKQLETDGVVRRYITGENDSACYQYVAEPQTCQGHFHAVCLACGNVLHMDSRTLPALSQEMHKNHDFIVDDTRTVIYGRCKACREDD